MRRVLITLAAFLSVFGLAFAGTASAAPSDDVSAQQLTMVLYQGTNRTGSAATVSAVALQCTSVASATGNAFSTADSVDNNSIFNIRFWENNDCTGQFEDVALMSSDLDLLGVGVSASSYQIAI